MSETTIQQWLNSLGMLSQINPNQTEFALKAAAFASLLADEFPPQAFTKASLRYVATNAVKGFPTYGELVQFLRKWWQLNMPTRAAIPAPREPDPHEPTPQERAAVAERVAQCKAVITQVATKWRAADTPTRPLHRYLTPEQLDLVNPLPNGTRRALRAVAA